ncbi:MAG: anthranilate synthase component I family protein [Thermoanaerobaculia bacterium]
MRRLDEAARLRERAAGRFVPVARVLRQGPFSPDALLYELERRGSECVLLESAETTEEIGRYSFIAVDPAARLTLEGGRVIEERDGLRSDRGTSLLPALESFAVQEGLVADSGLPPLPAGAVGYLAYDAVRHFEEVPDRHRPDSRLPDALFLFFEALFVFDHLREELLGVTTLDARDPASREDNLAGAMERLDALESRMRETGRVAVPPPPAAAPRPMRAGPADEFLRSVARAREEILAGEVYQVVLSRRWDGVPAVDPLEVYRALRSLNPSPYMYYLKTREATILGASPEMLVRCRGGSAETRPIAGTVPRGRNAGEDDELAARLRADPKERAEHVMLVDLARNDLGRVCEVGSVVVSRYGEVERFSHVQHLVSQVRGRLGAGRTSVDLLGACFPAGTLTGAPKIRAMELIDELESARRGLYGGAVGYLDASGRLDMAIAIRTAVVTGDAYRIQAGAGIVADSIPEQELAETEVKAAALLHAIEIAGDPHRHRLPTPESRLTAP